MEFCFRRGGFLGPLDPVSLVEEGLLVVFGAAVSGEVVGQSLPLFRICYEDGLAFLEGRDFSHRLGSSHCLCHPPYCAGFGVGINCFAECLPVVLLALLDGTLCYRLLLPVLDAVGRIV